MLEWGKFWQQISFMKATTITPFISNKTGKETILMKTGKVYNAPFLKPLWNTHTLVLGFPTDGGNQF